MTAPIRPADPISAKGLAAPLEEVAAPEAVPVPLPVDDGLVVVPVALLEPPEVVEPDEDPVVVAPPEAVLAPVAAPVEEPETVEMGCPTQLLSLLEPMLKGADSAVAPV